MKHFILASITVLATSRATGMEDGFNSETSSQVVPLAAHQPVIQNTYFQVTPIVKFNFDAIEQEFSEAKPEDRILYWYQALKKYAAQTDEDAFGERVAFGKVIEEKFHDQAAAAACFKNHQSSIVQKMAFYRADDEQQRFYRHVKSWWRSSAKPEFFLGLGFMALGSYLGALAYSEDAVARKILTIPFSLVSIGGIIMAGKAFKAQYRTLRGIQKIANLLVDSATKNYAVTIFYTQQQIVSAHPASAAYTEDIVD